ncbi:hypothetical protein DPMN_054290 [Dreissena polymorpha]|uniref:Uncharacterized protein n=1 Tax=Dreissena polymorpha TaxID=45954 RepID=A0A9D4HRG2_DREPO|nr:hypothetical protein DPMN_054273 [Dreissena polymorpha]KAH3728336.1 hypothetical protein DPMN_054290 [Dreissena polymorpha]
MLYEVRSFEILSLYRIVNEKLEKYQQQCNTFFLEVVTQLCFALRSDRRKKFLASCMDT